MRVRLRVGVRVGARVRLRVRVMVRVMVRVRVGAHLLEEEVRVRVEVEAGLLQAVLVVLVAARVALHKPARASSAKLAEFDGRQSARHRATSFQHPSSEAYEASPLGPGGAAPSRRVGFWSGGWAAWAAASQGHI